MKKDFWLPLFGVLNTIGYGFYGFFILIAGVALAIGGGSDWIAYFTYIIWAGAVGLLITCFVYKKTVIPMLIVLSVLLAIFVFTIIYLFTLGLNFDWQIILFILLGIASIVNIVLCVFKLLKKHSQEGDVE